MPEDRDPVLEKLQADIKLLHDIELKGDGSKCSGESHQIDQCD